MSKVNIYIVTLTESLIVVMNPGEADGQPLLSAIDEISYTVRLT